jgi:hypothetical protein
MFSGHDQAEAIYDAIKNSEEQYVKLTIVQAGILLDLIDANQYPIVHSKLEQAISIAKGRNE